MPEVEWRPPVRMKAQAPEYARSQTKQVTQVSCVSDTPGPSHGAGPGTHAERPATSYDEKTPASTSAQNPYAYAEQDTAKWNSLLLWAREQRGPQWDVSTGLYVYTTDQLDGMCRVERRYTMGRLHRTDHRLQAPKEGGVQ